MTAVPGDPVEPVPMRIGDRERNSALEALGEHVAAGRIDLDEYGERSAKVTVARTSADLSALFSDLPQPHPLLPTSTPPRTTRAGAAGQVIPMPPPIGDPMVAEDPRIVPVVDDRSGAQRAAAAIIPLTAIIAVILFFAVPGIGWWIFLAPAVVGIIGGAIWGDTWKNPGELSAGERARRQAQRNRRQALRNHRRGQLGRGRD